MRIATTIFAGLLLLAGSARAQVPASVGHQGVLLLPGGRLPLDQDLDLSFSVYDVASGGTALYTYPVAAVPVRRGGYNVLLQDGAQTLADVFGGDGPRFLEVTIVAAPLEPELDMTTLHPRQVVAAAPYAIRSGAAEALVGEAGSVPGGGLILWDQATGCGGAARACPCGYDEAGEFRGRTIRGADRLGLASDLPDDPGVSLGVAGGAGRFGDVLTVAEAPAHSHDMSTEGVHDHPLSYDTFIAWGTHDTFIETDEDNRHGAFYDDGLTTEAGDHRHVAQSSGGGAHYHPFRTVLFCRRK